MSQRIGAQIRGVIEKRGMTVTEFASRINKSRENAYSIFNRKTIDTSLLQIISEVLAYDFFKQLSPTFQELEAELEKVKSENSLLKDYNALLKQQQLK
jgi:transcriptional regulator with XRE-family HTH domain